MRLGIFRECGMHLRSSRYYYPEDYDFKADMARLYNHPGLDCVELYETLTFSQHPEMREVIRQLVEGK